MSNFSLAEWNEISEKCFSHTPLGAVVFVASAIADFPAQPPKGFKVIPG